MLSRQAKKSTLTDKFIGIQTIPSVSCVTYTNFLDQLMRDKSKHMWKVRVKSHGNNIGHMLS